MAEPLNSTHSNEEDEMEDTATSKPEKQQEEIDKEVEFEKIKTMEAFLEFAASKRIEQVQEFVDYINRKPKEQVENEGHIKEVFIEDNFVLNDLLLYKQLAGVFPFESLEHMQKNYYPWINMGHGNMAGWYAKIEQLKNKYKNRVGPIEPGQQEEFELWKMVFGNEGSSSGDNDDDQNPVP